MQQIIDFFSYDNLIQFTEFMRTIGPIGGVLLIMLEGVLTFLPQSVFVALNVYFYGFWLGSIASYTGTIIISILTYLLFLKLSHTKFLSKFLKKPNVKKVGEWLSRNRVLFLILYFSTPVTSASAMCIACGLAKMPFKDFLIPMLIGKTILILSISTIGKNMVAFSEKPFFSAFIILLIVGIYMLANKILSKSQEKEKKDDLQSAEDKENSTTKKL